MINPVHFLQCNLKRYGKYSIQHRSWQFAIQKNEHSLFYLFSSCYTLFAAILECWVTLQIPLLLLQWIVRLKKVLHGVDKLKHLNLQPKCYLIPSDFYLMFWLVLTTNFILYKLLFIHNYFYTLHKGSFKRILEILNTSFFCPIFFWLKVQNLFFLSGISHQSFGGFFKLNHLKGFNFNVTPNLCQIYPPARCSVNHSWLISCSLLCIFFIHTSGGLSILKPSH